MPISQPINNIIIKILKFILSLSIALAISWLTWNYADSYLVTPYENNGPYELAKQISGISGVILGFVLTALSILTAVMDKTLISNMVRTGHFKNFVKQAFYSCAWLVILIIVSLGSLVVQNAFLKIAFTLIMGVTAYTMIALVTTARRFYNIIIVMSSR